MKKHQVWSLVVAGILAICLMAGCAAQVADGSSEASADSKAPMESSLEQESKPEDEAEQPDPEDTDTLSPDRRFLLERVAWYYTGESKGICWFYCGEVGDYSLCYGYFFGVAEETMLWHETYEGYTIHSGSIGHPSGIHLYLVGDDRIYTFNAGYHDGLVADMSAVAELLQIPPEDCDPEGGTTGRVGENGYGFDDGVCRLPETKTLSPVRKTLVEQMIEQTEEGKIRAAERYMAFGEVGGCTLCAVYFETEEGVKSPSSTYLYLVSDNAVYTLNAAYRAGLFTDLTELTELLPESFDDRLQGREPGSLPEDVNDFGFLDGVFRAGTAFRARPKLTDAERELLGEIVRQSMDMFTNNVQQYYRVHGRVDGYILCEIRFAVDEGAMISEEVYDGYRIHGSSLGAPSQTHLYLLGNGAVYTLNAAYYEGLIPDMRELYDCLPELAQGGYDAAAENTPRNELDTYGFQNGVYRPGAMYIEGKEQLSEPRAALIREVLSQEANPVGGQRCLVLGQFGSYTVCELLFYRPDRYVSGHGGERYGGYTFYGHWTEFPSASLLYLVSDDAVYTLNAAYYAGLLEDMHAFADMLPRQYVPGYLLGAEDTPLLEDRDVYGFVNGVYRKEE